MTGVSVKIPFSLSSDSQGRDGAFIEEMKSVFVLPESQLAARSRSGGTLADPAQGDWCWFKQLLSQIVFAVRLVREADFPFSPCPTFRKSVRLRSHLSTCTCGKVLQLWTSSARRGSLCSRN